MNSQLVAPKLVSLAVAGVLSFLRGFRREPERSAECIGFTMIIFLFRQ